MSKNTDSILLVPGEDGWEIWSSQGEGDFSFVTATGAPQAGEIESIPAGDLTMLFPVRAITAVPMRVTSDDESLFPDLAALHAERLGLRPDPMAGQLTDVFVVAREQENSALLAVFLRPPEDGELPAKGPKIFDLSARAYAVEGDTLAIWREFGRWVFGLFHQGILVYCQATAVNSSFPDDALGREIRLSLIQLGIQGLAIHPQRAVVWSSHADLDASRLEHALGLPVEVTARPVPRPPAVPSKLLPADVRAARRDAQRRRNITLAVAATVTVYLGLIGWLAFGIFTDLSQAKKLIAAAEATAPDAEEYAVHIAKWDELGPAIDLTHNPVDILNRIASCIPPNSGLRLREADISAMDVKLRGEAQQLQAVNTFSLRLSRHTGLSQFDWQTPEPNQSTRGWDFTYSVEVPLPTQP